MVANLHNKLNTAKWNLLKVLVSVLSNNARYMDKMIYFEGSSKFLQTAVYINININIYIFA